jgi:hypothetical protein
MESHYAALIHCLTCLTNDQGLQHEALEPLHLLPYAVVLERAWSNLTARSAAPSFDRDGGLAATKRRRRTRVTPQLRAEVVRRYRAGRPSRVVAEELGIGKATALKVLRSEGVPLKPVGARY